MSHGARKICLVGDFFVGKTSTAARFQSNTFSEKYLATVVVSINTRDLQLDADNSIRMVMWDLASIKEITPLNINYLRSAGGIVYVADSTRQPTLEHALFLKNQIDQIMGVLPCIFLINKVDLKEEREITPEDLQLLISRNIDHFETSALTGNGVTEAFTCLARKLL
jgi:small GTP-binding protein